ncbi:hypothetical protein B0H14DRAFT_2637650 [Mycena olivaceomarginata]|nr:hypothetical protein B0H14DRAFT_2637650 [Mycena olivaceomarginata]
MVSVDSYFWGQPYLWPEWHGIYFNVMEGTSADWDFSGSRLLDIAPAQTATFCPTSIAICSLLVFPGAPGSPSANPPSSAACSLALLANLGATALLTVAGMRNYPGGHAMAVTMTTRPSVHKSV